MSNIKKFIKKLRYKALGFVIGKTPVVANVDVHGATLTVKSQTNGIHPYNATISNCAFMGQLEEKR